jgi:hypothetical protein
MPSPIPELYLPLPSAVQAKALDLSGINPHNPQDAAMMVANGRMPNRAGVVELPGGVLGAFDLVSVQESSGGQLSVFPLPKSFVGGSGQLAAGGQVVLATEETVRSIAEVLPWSIAQWHPEFYRIGEVGMRHLFGSPTLELHDVSDDGRLIASPPRRYF